MTSSVSILQYPRALILIKSNCVTDLTEMMLLLKHITTIFMMSCLNMDGMGVSIRTSLSTKSMRKITLCSKISKRPSPRSLELDISRSVVGSSYIPNYNDGRRPCPLNLI